MCVKLLVVVVLLENIRDKNTQPTVLLEMIVLLEYVNPLYKDEMLSVCPHFFRHARSSVVSLRIDTRLAQYEAPVLGEHGDFFKVLLSPVVRRL